MKRGFAAVVAALLLASGIFVSGARGVPLPGVHQDVIDGDTTPAKLSAFGLFHFNDPKQPLGSFPYTLNTPLFSDYAEKHRFMSIPAGKKAHVLDDGTIDFPIGTVLVKSFGWPDFDDDHPVETRLLIRREQGWIALPYIWDADGKDATLAIAGRRAPVTFKSPDGAAHSIDYGVPNRNQCKECHNHAGTIMPIGPKARNLVLPATVGADTRALYFDNPEALKPVLPRWDDPQSGTLAERARAYLDVNCSHCHNPQGSASNSGLFLRWTDPVGVNYGIEKRPTAAGRGSGGMEFAIKPGDPDHSFLIYRLESLDPGIAMPELGRSTVHKEAAQLLRQWIAEMPKDGQKPGA